MPTVTLQVGQCGNQLGRTFWELLTEQHAHCSSSSSSMLSHEWFSRVRQQQQAGSGVAAAGDLLEGGQSTVAQQVQPRCICVDSEAKVVKRWQGHGQGQGQGQSAVHMLGRGGGCGNNWCVHTQIITIIMIEYVNLK